MLVNLSLIFRIPLEYGGVVNAQIGYAAGNCPDRQTAVSKNDSESFVHRERTRAKLRLFFAIPRFYETSGSEYFTSIC